ncbi:MAG: flagellar basal body M-ring protein FliF [Spirochaetes bacterium]|nr:flagellar basal body M-ring protein FliF [Spirochaetota bacterium]
MNEWLKKLVEQITALWEKWTATQKIILFSVIGVSVVAIILIVTFSASPSMVPLLRSPITDENYMSRIEGRLDVEGVRYQVRSDKVIMVPDEQTARRMRAILVREDLIPPKTNPWAIFDLQRWTITDFERNVNLQRAITKSLEQHILALDDIDAVSVTLVVPKKELFSEDQNPVTASVIITPKPGSDFTQNRKKIEGVVKLIKYAVAGLKDDNIVITDENGIQLNDFKDLRDVDRIDIAKREIKTKTDLERQYQNEIMGSLQNIFGKERVEIVKLDINLDMSQETIKTEEHFPITMKKDNPLTPYDETVVTPSITISKQTTDEKFQGTGFNPEGPPGQEGQTPPAYKDLSNLVGKYSKNSVTQNEVVNTKNIVEKKSPWAIKRLTVSVALDGIWKKKYDDKGQVMVNPDGSIKREYVPVPDEDVRKAIALVKDAIGYDKNRGDSVTVEALQFDRTSQFEQEDAQFRKQMQLKRTMVTIILALGVLFLAAIMYRFISKEMERRRRLREEELARQHQAMREAALRSAEEQGVEVELSIEERARLEMQENAINMAREHPEDVAQLIRTWLIEE